MSCLFTMWRLLIIVGLLMQGSCSSGDGLGDETNRSQRNGSCYDLNADLDTGQNTCFQCLDKSQVILPQKVCDGVIDCSDMSDECLCENMKLPNQICDLLYNPDIDMDSTCTKTPGHLSCGDGDCIDKIRICDGTQDCLNGYDEKFCSNELIAERPTATRKTIFCNQTTRANLTNVIEATMCDDVLECDEKGDECVTICHNDVSLLPPFCGKEFDCLPGSMICDGVWDSENLDSCNNTRTWQEEMDCANRFYCRNGERISIPIDKVCDLNIDCDNAYDEDIGQGCSDDRFYCHDSENVTNSSISFIPRYKVQDGFRDCQSGIDECNESENSFSSKTDMISVPFLHAVLWILGIVAFIGNISVICFTSWVFITKRKILHVVSRCHHLLLINLSIADLLMSVYLLATAIQSVRFSGNYCYEDLTWRSSRTCVALGAIAFISSEMSVAIMTLMAGFRFATIYKPIETFYSRKTEKIVRLLIAFSWVTSIAIGILPVLGPIMHSFTPLAALSCPIYNSTVLDIRKMAETSERVLKYFKRSNLSYAVSLPESFTTTSDLEKIHALICPRSVELRWLGFYGQNSACLPRLFAKTSEAAWEYSIAFIVYNFVSFFVMVIFYVLIVKVVLQNSRKLGQTNEVPTCKMQKRVTRLLLTDFLCWIPICVIGFIYLSGVQMKPIVFAVCGIVLLPLNSALNPILYSGVFDTVYKSVSKLQPGVSGSTSKGKPSQTSTV